MLILYLFFQVDLL